MILQRLPLIVPDGSGPLPVPTAAFSWTWGDDVLIPVALKKANGQPYPLVGPVALILALKEHEGDPLPLLALSVVITNAALGEGEFLISRTYRALLQPGYFTAGVQFEDDNIGVDRRDTVLRPSRVSITEGIADLDQPVNVPPAQQPLAQGPPGVILCLTREIANVALAGLQTLNGVSLAEGDGVLLLGQTAGAENGPWLVHAGAWTRPTTFAPGAQAAGLLVVTIMGTLQADTVWICNTDPPLDVIDTDPLGFLLVVGGPGRTPAIGVLGAVDVEDPINVLGPRRRLTLDDIDPAFSITSFTPTFGTTKELGDTIVNPGFAASYNAALASATIDENVTPGPIALLTPFLAFAYGTPPLPARTYSKSGIGQTVNWQLAATKAPSGPVKLANVTATWQARRFFGLSVLPGAYNETFIEGLAGSALAPGFAGIYAFGSGGGTQRIYLCWPSAFGNPASIKDQGDFAFPMTKVAAAVPVTNAFAVLVAGGYDVWESGITIVPFTLTVS